MTNLITKQYDWEAAMDELCESITTDTPGSDLRRSRIEKYIGRIVMDKHLDPQAEQRPYFVRELATLFFDMNGFTFECFKRDDQGPCSQSEYMIRLMEMEYAISVVYSDNIAQEAFGMWLAGDHDT